MQTKQHCKSNNWSLCIIHVRLQLCHKEIPAQVFSLESCENFKEIFLIEHLRATASDLSYLTAILTQPAFTCSKSTMETPEQCVTSVQS